MSSISEDDAIETLQFVGTGDELNAFVATLEDAGVLVELARSGAVTLTPGAAGLSYDEADNA